MISFEHVTKDFRGTRALDDVSFTVPPGSVTGFLGPNGAGKTTAMRVLLGHSRATSGTATVLGRRYADLDNPAFQVGSLLDAAAVHPGRTGRETVAVAAQTIGVSPARVDDVLELVGLTPAEGRRFTGGYSLGMRQRLGIAVALLGRPSALVLDEPANGLDPQGIHWLRGLLRSVADEGCSVLLSSHHLHETAAVVDRVVVVGRGRVLAEGPLDAFGTVAELEERYFALTTGLDRTAA